MVETRVYITNDLSMNNVDNETFIQHCEDEGGVYSLEGFQNAWNNNQLINYIPNATLMRIINIYIDNDYTCCANVNKNNDYGCVEWCTHCECEVFLSNDFNVQICPNCGKKILPCNQCETFDCGNCPLGNKYN